MKFYLKEIGIILLGAIFLCSPAFYNSFPLVYPDTGAYIVSGFEGIVLPDRPIMYGLFIRHSSMNFSIWFTVYAQVIIVATMLYILLREIIQVEKFHFYYFAIIVILTAFTGLGWYAGQIMPDIFAPMLCISFCYFLFSKKLTVVKSVFVSFVFLLSIAVHYSHLLMTLIISTLIIILFLISLMRKKHFYVEIKRACIVVFISFFSWLLILVFNYSYGGGFQLSKGSQAFLMSHYIETGVMKEYLKENCDKPELQSCKMCAYKDSLEICSGHFLWNYPSTLFKTGGWIGSKDEYNYIFRQMNSDPDYLIKNIYCSFRFGFSQLFLNKVGNGLCAYPIENPPGGTIKKYFEWESNAYQLSTQSFDRLPPIFEIINNCHNALLIFSIILLFFYFVYQKERDNLFKVGLFLLLFVILNAFATAGINIPHERLQCRVVWLIILFAFVLLINKKDKIIYKVKSILIK